MDFDLHPINCTWDVVTTCIPGTVFFPLGVRLCSNNRKKKIGQFLPKAFCKPSFHDDGEMKTYKLRGYVYWHVHVLYNHIRDQPHSKWCRLLVPLRMYWSQHCCSLIGLLHMAKCRLSLKMAGLRQLKIADGSCTHQPCSRISSTQPLVLVYIQ